MLTVLHRGPDGSERIFEAESVTRYPPEGEQSVPPMGEIVAHGVVGQPNETITLGIFEPFGAVFVMNRFGQTVARYNYPYNGTVAKAI